MIFQQVLPKLTKFHQGYQGIKNNKISSQILLYDGFVVPWPYHQQIINGRLTISFQIVDRNTRIVDIIENEPLTAVQIEKLSPYSSGRYVIPYNQSHRGKSRCFALILYNTHNRDGADNEADKLEDSLQAIGCEIIRVEW